MRPLTCQECFNALYYKINDDNDIDVCIPHKHIELNMQHPPDKVGIHCKHAASSEQSGHIFKKVEDFRSAQPRNTYRIHDIELFTKHFPELADELKTLIIKAKTAGVEYVHN